MAASARAWSVAKLRELNFEGDAEALGQYIDAVIENNRDAENGDPDLLRSQVTRDLQDFLAESAAGSFVDALMRHLSPNSTSVKPPQTAAEPKPEPSRPSHVDEKLRQPLSSSEPRRRSPRRDRAEKQRLDNDSRDRSDPAHRRVDRVDRRPNRQTVMQRLGDRVEDLREHKRQRTWDPKSPREPRESRQPNRLVRERQPVQGPRPNRLNSGDIRDRLGSRNPKRPREDPNDNRDRRDLDERDSKHRRQTDSARRRSDNYDRQRLPDDRPRRDDRPGHITPPRYDQNGKAPPPWPPGIVAQMGLMPPPFPPPHGILPPVPPLIPGMGTRGRGGFRSRESGRAAMSHTAGNNPSAANSKYRHFILVAKAIPEDKMMIGPIYAFFQRFGMLKDVVRFPPDKAFILFDRRDSAQHALSSVDAVMGNRHIKLSWARDSDFAEAGLRLTDEGTLVEDEHPKKPANQHHHHNHHPHASAAAARTDPRPTPSEQKLRAESGEKKVRQVAEEKERKIKEAEEDLKRKKEQIAELRRQQDERIAELTARKQQLLARQHEIFAKISSANDEEKLRMKNELVAVQEETIQVQQQLKPKPVAAPKPDTAKRFTHSPSAYRVDNRPKQVLVRGAKNDVLADGAASAFHDTERAESFGKNEWLLTFLSRRAAESAIRAQKVLKRTFGTDATAVIISPAMLEAAQSTASVADTDATKNVSPPAVVKADMKMMEVSDKAQNASAVAK
ncbi:Zinc finger CCCH domain-containing protein 41 [Gracilariopsis chorda]|uniref:Zinc finger CCCH domain-containing protein 41 n=1 Tax=Gracilariopsis chorda TaxID=448386 RepID=A0A2V3IT27_9FLOR|nr:Zinc finger CCCH domain-containing protein 41 [Gracilariopsis chorda]|eukprot:PXF45271.1 Zinc finger CCCH domain-containing protein 41 [Gracilariopsis chorda]